MSTLSQAWVFSASNSTIFLTGDNSLAALSLGGAVAIGDLVVVQYTTQNTSRSVTGVADSAGTTYTAARSIDDGAAGRVQHWFGIAASTGAGASIVVTLSAGHGEKAQIGAAAFGGCASDQSGRTTNGPGNSTAVNNTAHNSGTVTPPNATGVIVAGSSRTNNTWTEDGAFTEATGGGDDNFYFGHLLNPSGTEELNMTSSTNAFATMTIVAFAGTASGFVPRRTLLGVG